MVINICIRASERLACIIQTNRFTSGPHEGTRGHKGDGVWLTPGCLITSHYCLRQTTTNKIKVNVYSESFQYIFHRKNASPWSSLMTLLCNCLWTFRLWFSFYCFQTRQLRLKEDFGSVTLGNVWDRRVIKGKINSLPQKHKTRWLTIPAVVGYFCCFAPLCFSSSSTFSALLHLHLSSVTPSSAPPSSFLLRSKKNGHLGAFWKHLTPMKFKRQTSPTLVSAFFSGIWGKEGRRVEQHRV